MKRYIRLWTFVALMVATAILASAQGNRTIPRDGACFYTDVNFRGNYFCMAAGENANAVPAGFNDRIRSIRVYGRTQVTLFNGSNFSSVSTAISRSVDDLSRLVVAEDHNKNWAARISSIQVAEDRFGRGPEDAPGQRGRRDPRDGACFFTDVDFRGESFCLAAGENANVVPAGFNDRIRSIRVFGRTEVKLYNGSNFSSVSTAISRSIDDLSRLVVAEDHNKNWAARISSIQVGEGRGYDEGRGDRDRWYSERDRDDERGNSGQTVSCASMIGRTWCKTPGRVNRVRLVDQKGDRCEWNRTFGIENGRLWTSNGCSGTFEIR